MIEVIYDGMYSQYRILNGMGGLVHSLGLKWPEESVVDDENEEEMEEGEEKVAAN